MKITHNALSNPTIKGSDFLQGIATAGKDAAPESSAAEADLYIPSQDWVRLQAALHQQPEIRNDRVAQAGERLTAGYYFSADSALQTAEAMLNSAD